MSDLRSFLTDLAVEKIPENVLTRTRYLMLDLLGNGLSAVETPLHRFICEMAQEQFAAGPGQIAAPVLFNSGFASPAGAALAGGMTIDAIDAHDGHKLTKGHVGCAVLPALLACLPAMDRKISGLEFLALLVAGYEIGTRSGIALHASAPDYHSSGAWNAVTCAALGAHMLDLDPVAFGHALGIAEYHGPRSQMMRAIDHPTMLKDGSGWGGMAGVSAAFMARKGFTGAPAISVLADDVQHAWQGLGNNWMVMEQYVKGFPVCRWGQPAVAGALQLRELHGFASTDIVGVEVKTFHEATRLFSDVPADTEQAQYAISFPVAAALARGEVGIGEISSAAFSDQEILDVHRKITLVESDDYNAAFPAQRYADVSITLADGRVLSVENTMAKGDPETPYTNAEIEEKFFWLTAPVCSVRFASRVRDAVMALDDTRSGLETLVDAISRKPVPTVGRYQKF